MSKTIIGTVSSNATDKTIVVKVVRRKTHPIYRKQYLDTKKLTAHDEKNEAQVGDRVAITECRPLSATKHFTLTRIVERPALREEALAATKVEVEPKPPKTAAKPSEEKVS
jgi:small subunit ribosomal protein S17